MDINEKRNWLINIENSMEFVSSILGETTVNAILKKYGSGDVETINDADLHEVFSELYAMESDLRSD